MVDIRDDDRRVPVDLPQCQDEIASVIGRTLTANRELVRYRMAFTWLLGLIGAIEGEIKRCLDLLVKCFLGESPGTHSLLHNSAE